MLHLKAIQLKQPSLAAVVPMTWKKRISPSTRSYPLLFDKLPNTNFKASVETFMLKLAKMKIKNSAQTENRRKILDLQRLT